MKLKAFNENLIPFLKSYNNAILQLPNFIISKKHHKALQLSSQLQNAHSQYILSETFQFTLRKYFL